MTIQEAIEKVNKQAGKDVVVNYTNNIDFSELTIEQTNGEIVAVQIDGEPSLPHKYIVRTSSTTYYATEKYGIDTIFNIIHGMCRDYKNVVGKEYSNNFGSIQKCDDGTWVRINLVVGFCVGYSRSYKQAFEWMRLNSEQYRSGRSGLSGY